MSSIQTNMSSTQRSSSTQRVACFALLAFFAAGCQTYKEQGSKAFNHWESGDVASAVTEFGEHAQKNEGTKDHVIWHLEHATALRVNDQPKESLMAFEAAERKIDEYESMANTSVSREAGATISNQANLPYRGRAYDKIMLNTYKALNYWEMGQREPDEEKAKRYLGEARANLFRSYQRQTDAVVENARRIEEAQKEEQESKESETIQKARQDAKFAAQLADLNPPTNPRISGQDHRQDYVNPFTVFIYGLYFHHHSTDRTDLSDRARFQFDRLKKFAPENTFIESEIASIDAKIKGEDQNPVTYVIFETGKAPSREQVKISIPVIASKVSYVGAAFPKLKVHDDNYHPNLRVQVGGKTTETVLIASMDDVVGTAFRNELPIIITKTIISTIVKAVAAYAVNETAEKQGEVAGMLSKFATAVVQEAVNIADLRTWTTLPKQFQYCRIPTPSSGEKIRLITPDGAKTHDVINLSPYKSHIVYVRSINKNTPLFVNQFEL